MPIPVAARLKAGVCSRSLAGAAGSKTAEGMDVSVVSVMFYLEVTATG